MIVKKNDLAWIGAFWHSSVDVVSFEELDKLVPPTANSESIPRSSSFPSPTPVGPEALALYPAEAFRLRDWFRRARMTKEMPRHVPAFSTGATAQKASGSMTSIRPFTNPFALSPASTQFSDSVLQRPDRSLNSLHRTSAPEPPPNEPSVARQQFCVERSLAGSSFSVGSVQSPSRPSLFSTPHLKRSFPFASFVPKENSVRVASTSESPASSAQPSEQPGALSPMSNATIVVASLSRQLLTTTSNDRPMPQRLLFNHKLSKIQSDSH